MDATDRDPHATDAAGSPVERRQAMTAPTGWSTPEIPQKSAAR